MNRKSTFWVMLIGAWTVPTAMAGCSADGVSGETTDASTGGGTSPSSGGNGGLGGNGSGGLTSPGGKGSGGNGTDGRSVEGGTGEGDGGCVEPNYLVYRSPGCDGTVMPQCRQPAGNNEDAGLVEACACDGTRILGGGGFLKPYRHLGQCSVADSGFDAASEASDAANDAR
jgi:hypothetical protein